MIRTLPRDKRMRLTHLARASAAHATTPWPFGSVDSS